MSTLIDCPRLANNFRSFYFSDQMFSTEARMKFSFRYKIAVLFYKRNFFQLFYYTKEISIYKQQKNANEIFRHIKKTTNIYKKLQRKTTKKINKRFELFSCSIIYSDKSEKNYEEFIR